jgi:hypothetical protein
MAYSWGSMIPPSVICKGFLKIRPYFVPFRQMRFEGRMHLKLGLSLWTRRAINDLHDAEITTTFPELQSRRGSVCEDVPADGFLRV